MDRHFEIETPTEFVRSLSTWLRNFEKGCWHFAQFSCFFMLGFMVSVAVTLGNDTVLVFLANFVHKFITAF